MTRPRDPDVAAINRTRRIAVMDDDVQIPITHFFDHGEDTDDADAATSAVAGPLPDGRWVVVDLTRFTGQAS